MAVHKNWNAMTDNEKLEIINPALDNIRKILLRQDTLDCTISTYSDNEKPEIRNVAWEFVHIPYMSTDIIEIKINRIKRT